MKFQHAFRAAVLLCFVGVCFQAHAVEPYQEYRKRIESAQTLTALTDQLMGDSVSLYNGVTEFSAIDIDLPGNNALPVQLTRRFPIKIEPAGTSTYNLDLDGAGNWDVDVPYISGMFESQYGWGSAIAPTQRCSVLTSPQVNHAFDTADIWQGYSIHGAGGDRTMLLVETQTPQPADGQTHRWTTRERDAFTCIPMLRGMTGEGFSMLTSSGLRYDFNVAVSRAGGRMTYYMDSPVAPYVVRTKIFLLASKVTDRFGNTVTYQYNAAGNPISITSSDGRSIALTYTSGHLTSATANGRTWQYHYGTGATADMLTAVIQPDASKWQYAYTGTLMPDYEPWDGGSSSGCGLKPPAIHNTYDFTVTHPSGAVGTFHFSNTRHFRAGIHASECLLSSDQQNGTYYYSYHLHTPNYFDVMSLLTKTITGPGLVQPMVWSYDYGITQQSLWGSSGQAADYPCTTCPTEKLVTVVQPDSTQVQYRYGFLYALNEGRLLGSSVLDAAGVVKKVDTTTYMTEAEAATPQNFFPRYGFIINGDDPSTAQIRPVTRQTIQQDGVTFTMLVNQGCGGTTVYCFDLYGNTTNATRSSTLGYSKTESTTYSHPTTSWVLGQVATVTCIAPASCANVVESKTDYDLASALPIRIYGPGTTAVPGKLQQTLTYNTDGTVATAKDGNNHTTTLANWKRGTPQAITYADGASVAANVDDNGWLTWIEDENDYRTCYGYDGLGRMASVTYPSETALHVCDTSTWNPTTSVFVSVAIPEYGLPANHWRQTVSTGNGRKVTYYDAMWRPVVQEQYDTANVTGTRSVSVKRYDVDGHPAYQSYPLASLTDYAALTVGTRSYYDALDRVTEVQQDSELGVLNTTTEYLTGFQTRVTNPRGFQTTTNYMAYDLPSTDWPVNVTMPETAVTKISRDAFGKPRAMTRKNAAGTLAVTRTYVYDDFQQLCKRIEPETSATLMEYDNAGNLAWSASGQAWMADTCDRSNVLASNRSNRVYDTRSRLINLMFPDGVGDQVWSYTPDGLTDQIVTFNSIDQGTAVTNAYHYNRRRMLNGQGESVHQQDWYTNGIGYGYDANGHLSVHTYPSGQSVAYAPNALGQATQAGSYATGVSYFPNGAIKQFTYGNGIVHTLTQNIRQLPDTSRDAYGAVETLDDGYDYDPNGNVAAISDGLATSAGRGNRTMSYDGLDRLTATISPMFASGTSYSYDTLDNLVRVKAPGRDHTYLYDSKWQLTNVTNTASGVSVIGLGYDPQGNLSNKNGVAYGFDTGNRLRTVSNVESYRYDGWGRRVLAWSPLGNILSQYSQGGELVYQYDARRSLRLDYLYLGGSLVAIQERPFAGGVAVKYLHTDALGSPVAVTDASRNVIERSEYEPYGLLLNRALHDGPGYTGHVSDAATGLSYMQQRYYDPGIGRFLSVDPVTANGNTGANFNRYWYANDNPYMFTDPDGRASKKRRDNRSMNSHSSNVGGVGNIGGGGGGSTRSNGALSNSPNQSPVTSSGGATVRVTRFQETSHSTIGSLTVDGTKIHGYTLEPAGPDSTTEGSDRRISEGTYSLTPHSGNHFQNVFEISGVKGRSAVLIHPGNYPDDTEGCVLPGGSYGKDKVSGSRPLLKELNDYISSHQPATIVITNSSGSN